MSATAVRSVSSSSFVPRQSRPASPSLPPPPAHLPLPPNRHASCNGPSHHRSSSVPGSPAFAPRMQDMERRGSSHLRNEVTDIKGKSQTMSPGAQAILKMLASLPAPLPESLPPTFVPKPSLTPSPTSHQSFSDYARSPHKRRSPSYDEDKSASVGLGLGLSVSSKKLRLTESSPKINPIKSPELYRSSSASSVHRLSDRGLTPVERGSPLISAKKELGKSGLRSEITEGLGSWSKDKFLAEAQSLRDRALLLKRHADAYSRSQSAQAKFVEQLPADPLRGLLCLTDACLLWLFAYWLDEQVSMRIRGSAYNESQPLREFVRNRWEAEMRRAEDEDSREKARAMVGLMHLVEAVIYYHLNTEHLAHLARRSKEISQSVPPSSTHGPSPPSTSNAESPTGQTGPSPAAHSTTSHNTSSNSPDSHSSQGVSDLFPIISTSTTATHRAHSYLLTSRHHLSLRILRTRFPVTFEHAIHSELSDEALPAPGDTLGAAKRLDIDVPERFAWPIELGMHCPVAHTAVFGRCLVSEYGRAIGGWQVKLDP